MKLWNEFKEFAMKGNVVDLAVGVIIGTAFGLIVTSLVESVLMPPLGWLTGGLDFKDKTITIQKAGEVHKITGKKLEKDVVISYGKFLNAVINFLIVAVSIFAAIKVINRLKREPPPPDMPPPPPTREEQLLTEIRDILKNRPA
jgi:large conductance mechanosensitive channel